VQTFHLVQNGNMIRVIALGHEFQTVDQPFVNAQLFPMPTAIHLTAANQDFVRTMRSQINGLVHRVFPIA